MAHKKLNAPKEMEISQADVAAWEQQPWWLMMSLASDLNGFGRVEVLKDEARDVLMLKFSSDENSALDFTLRADAEASVFFRLRAVAKAMIEQRREQRRAEKILDKWLEAREELLNDMFTEEEQELMSRFFSRAER